MHRNIFLSIICSVFLLFSLHAQEEGGEDKLTARIKGFVDTYHAVRTESPHDWMSSRTRVRGELTLEKGGMGMFVSMNATYNAILKDKTGIDLREAYLTYSKQNWEVKAGRQIIIWGVADAMRITDIVSPMDYTEFLAQDYDDIRIPVNALRIKYVRPAFSAEALLIPIPDFFILSAAAENPWAMTLGSPVPYTMDLEQRKPRKAIANMEFGGRIGFYLSGIDFSFSALHTWNKMPVFRKTMDAVGHSLSVRGEYRRMTMLGADFSLPLGKFVLRGEVAEYFHEAQEPAVGEDVRTNTSTYALLGLDWYPGNDWNVGLQYSHKYISGQMAACTGYRNAGMSTVRISKDCLHNTLNLSTFAYIDVSNGAVYNRLSADYAVNDQIHAIVGYDLFSADAGMFAMYKHNSEVWLKLKYSF